ncbi:MAG TPA: sugar kinase, partial [Gemmatimonadales bacterium]
MTLLVVGSIALDSVATPFGQTADAPGGSAVFFAAAGCLLHPVQVVGVIGSDYPLGVLKQLETRGVDLTGVEQVQGESFRWKAKYSYDLSSRETLDTRLGVFADFRPKIPAAFQQAKYVFLGNIDPELQ